jgi:hypothetical protein
MDFNPYNIFGDGDKSMENVDLQDWDARSDNWPTLDESFKNGRFASHNFQNVVLISTRMAGNLRRV